MKKLILFVLACSSLLHAVDQRDVEKFKTALRTWKSNESQQNLDTMLDLYEKLTFDTIRPQWAQLARNFANQQQPPVAIQKMLEDARANEGFEEEELVEMAPIISSPVISSPASVPLPPVLSRASSASSATSSRRSSLAASDSDYDSDSSLSSEESESEPEESSATSPSLSRRSSLSDSDFDMETKYDTDEDEITPSAPAMEVAEEMVIAPELPMAELEPEATTEEKAIIIEEILKQGKNHVVRQKALAFEAAINELEQTLNVLRNLDIRDAKVVAENTTLLDHLDELITFIKSEDNSAFYMDAAHKNSCNINEAKHLLKRARKTYTYVPQAPELETRKVFAPYSHDLKERLEKIRRFIHNARTGAAGKAWFTSESDIENNTLRAEKELQAIQHILHEEDLDGLVQDVGDLKTYLASKKLKEAYNALLKINDNLNVKRVAPLTQKEKDAYILAYDRLNALLNLRTGSLSEAEYNRINSDLALRYNQYKYKVQNARALLGNAPKNFAQKLAPTYEQINERAVLQNKIRELKGMMTGKAAIDVEAEYLELVKEFDVLKNNFSDATIAEMQNDLAHIQNLTMQRLKAKLVDQGLITPEEETQTSVPLKHIFKPRKSVINKQNI